MATTPYPFVANSVLTASQLNSTYNVPVSTKTASYVLVAADGGTRVAMNAAGATTITVNTSLFAAGDSVWLQNISSGVCTITAGTATVTTAGTLALVANSGGTLYFSSASAAIFFPSGVTAAVQPSGLTYITTATAAAAASLSVNGCFTSTYINYLLIINMPSSSTAATPLRMKMRVASVDASTNYFAGLTFVTNVGGPTRIYDGGVGTGMHIGYVEDTAGSNVITVYKPALVAKTSATGNFAAPGSSAAAYGVAGAFHNTVTAYDGFTLIPDSGTLTGDVRVYGIANS